MQPDLIVRVLRAYGLTARELLPSQKGYRNTSHPIRLDNGAMVNFILYKQEPEILGRIKTAHTIARRLHGSGLPVRRPYKQPAILRLAAAHGTRYGALYHYLPGATIPWESYSPTHIKLLGKAMSDMHTALAGAGQLAPRTISNELLAALAHIRRYTSHTNVTTAMRQKLKLYIAPSALDNAEHTLRLCQHLPRQHTLHMDFVRGNILFSARPALTGIIDFEKASHGHPVFDIARTLAFLLVDCAGIPPDKLRRYFLHSGYHKRGAGSYRQLFIRTGSGRIDILEQLLNIYLLYDFYRFLRHNPYESLADNAHFMRTRGILLARGQLTALDQHL